MEDIKNTKHHFSSGVYARQMELPAGFAVVTHAHKFDHMSILAKGRVVVNISDIKSEYIAPCVVEIKSGIEHGIYAITDSMWFCIHATNETDESKMDEVLSEQS